MNDFCRKYIDEVKNLFPIRGKKERSYIKSLAEDVESYCADEKVTSSEQLSENYGKPEEVVCSYISNMGVDEIAKRIKFSRHIKWLVIGLLCAAVAALIVYSIILVCDYQTYLSEAAVIADTVIS